ncbi:MAG: hypothetical protein DCC55_38685 [Chloroflexi bacterium]|nr:MAG: hypothetical protein DCC55_38685 [Chloroflexota bacterium]
MDNRISYQNLIDREIDRQIAEKTIAHPQYVVPEPPDRTIYMRRYFNQTLQQEMILRVVMEEGVAESVVITLHKTSQIARYLKDINHESHL